MPVALLSDCVRSFLQWAQPRFRPATVSLYKHYLHRFLAVHGERSIDQITRLDIELFSVKKHPLEVVRRFFKWAVVVGQVVATNPAAGVSVPKSGRRSRVLDRGECVRLRRRSSPALRAFVLGLEETGARPHELRNSRWSWIHATHGRAWTLDDLRRGDTYLRLDVYKGQGRRINPYLPRVIPISARLGRSLARLASASGAVDSPIWLSFFGGAWTANALRCAFRRLRDRVGENGVKDVKRVSPYTYRHTLATRLARQGVNGRLLADFLGHSTLDLLAWYVHPSTLDLCNILKPKDRS